jgi:chromosome segregation ATPase
MKKQEPLVKIPMDSTCISLINYKELNDTISYLSYSHVSLSNANKKLNKQVAELEAKVSKLEQKNAELQRSFEARSNAMVYWNKEYETLKKKLQELTDGGSGNAEAEKA